MTTKRHSILLWAALLVGGPVLVFAACGGDATPAPGKPAASGGPAASAKPVAAVATASASASGLALPPAVEYHEEDFAETEKSRDPFRSYFGVFQELAKTRVKSQRHVLLERYAVEELKLIALVTHTEPPRAMLVDPTGRGWVVTKGMFIGRAEAVRGSGPAGVDYEVNWRVDRIREGDIVLVREDPGHPDVPASTRVIALRPETTENTGEVEVH